MDSNSTKKQDMTNHTTFKYHECMLHKKRKFAIFDQIYCVFEKKYNLHYNKTQMQDNWQ